MEIRPATPADVPAVLPMVANLAVLHERWDPAKYGYLPEPAEMYRGWLTSRARDERSVFLVAERTDAMLTDVPFLVAFLVATVEREIPIYRLAEYGFIHDLWVEEPYRHEGIGRQMVMLAVERFKQLGVTQVRADTAACNDSARALMHSCGFRPSTIEMLLEMKPE